MGFLDTHSFQIFAFADDTRILRPSQRGPGCVHDGTLFVWSMAFGCVTSASATSSQKGEAGGWDLQVCLPDPSCIFLLCVKGRKRAFLICIMYHQCHIKLQRGRSMQSVRS